MSKCLTSILSISGTAKRLQLKSNDGDNFSRHLRQFNYYGPRPNFADNQYLHSQYRASQDTTTAEPALNLKTLPQPRLERFLTYVDFYGPSQREVLDFIKYSLLQKRTNKSQQPTQSLSDDMILPLLQIFSRKFQNQGSLNYISMNAALTIAENYTLNCQSLFELQILVSFLHLYKYAKTMREMKNKSHLL